jgi:hypothetical protein
MPAVSQGNCRGDLERDFSQKAQASKNGCNVYPSHAFAAQLAQDFPKRFPILERFAYTINWHAIIPFGSLPAAFRFSVSETTSASKARCCLLLFKIRQNFVHSRYAHAEAFAGSFGNLLGVAHRRLVG